MEIMWALTVLSGAALGGPAVLLDDDFNGLRPGMFSAGVIGAHAEYHYLRETAPQGNWVVSCFTTGTPEQRAWWVIAENDDAMLSQSIYYRRTHSHPFVCTAVKGSEFWKDYTVSARFAPESDKGQSGIAFRYRNDRCYYFFGVKGNKAILKVVNHAVAYHKPDEKILAERKFNLKPGEFLTATIRIEGDSIRSEAEAWARGMVERLENYTDRIQATVQQTKKVLLAQASQETEETQLPTELEE